MDQQLINYIIASHAFAILASLIIGYVVRAQQEKPPAEVWFVQALSEVYCYKDARDAWTHLMRVRPYDSSVAVERVNVQTQFSLHSIPGIRMGRLGPLADSPAKHNCRIRPSCRRYPSAGRGGPNPQTDCF